MQREREAEARSGGVMRAMAVCFEKSRREGCVGLIGQKSGSMSETEFIEEQKRGGKRDCIREERCHSARYDSARDLCATNLNRIDRTTTTSASRIGKLDKKDRLRADICSVRASVLHRRCKLEDERFEAVDFEEDSVG